MARAPPTSRPPTRRARTDEAAHPRAVSQAALGLAAALSLGGETYAQAPPPADGLSGADTLAPFFQALQAVKSGARTRPVHIIQLGDSHTAADHITGALRARLQANFGEGGRGAMPPGRPFAGYAPRQVDIAQSDGWRLEASFLPGNWTAAQRAAKPGQPAPVEAGPGPYGLSGWRLVSSRPGATLTLTADPGSGVRPRHRLRARGAGRRRDPRRRGRHP